MKKLTLCVSALVAATLFASTIVFADTYTVTCPKTTQNTNLYKKSLEALVVNSIDPALFSNPRAQVQLRKVSLLTPPGSVSPGSILTGVNLVNGVTPTGLTFTVNGTAGFVPSCMYTYRVSIIASGTNLATNQRFITRTESFVDLAGVATNFKRFKE